MGARGPSPQPTALKVLRGNPGHQRLNRREPKPRPVAPKCPAWLDHDAKREWRRILPELDRVGLLTSVDMAALAGYCQAFSRWKEAERVLTEEGLVFSTEKGYLVPRPEVAIAKTYLGFVKTFCAEFGLTPSSRGRMTLPEVDDDDGDGLLD
jgi:P27 family predicted phage terminase small subunit